jgi:hypothetical protein
MIPYGNMYKSTIEASIWRTVKCEFCGCDFAYLIPIKVTGLAFSPLFLRNRAASNNAAISAHQEFENKTHKISKMVRCPDCNKFQTDMVRKARILPLTLVVSVVLALVFALLTNSREFRAIFLSRIEIACIIIPLAFLAIIAVQWPRSALFIGGVVGWLVLSTFLGPNAFPVMLATCLPLIGFLLLRVLSYDPNSAREITKQHPTSKFKVIRRSEADAMLAQLTPEQRAEINFPTWPS